MATAGPSRSNDRCVFVAAIRHAFWPLVQSFREIVVLQRRQSYKHGSSALFDPRRALARVSCTVESELQIFFRWKVR
jgi:hypothetical protein